MKTETRIAFIIPILFIASVALLNTSFTNDKYGNQLGLILFYGTVVWATIHIVILSMKRHLTHKIIWFILTAIPILYFLFMIISGTD